MTRRHKDAAWAACVSTSGSVAAVTAKKTTCSSEMIDHKQATIRFGPGAHAARGAITMEQTARDTATA